LSEQRFTIERPNFRNWFATVIKHDVLQFLRNQIAKSHGKGGDGLNRIKAREAPFDAETLRELKLFEPHRAPALVQHKVREIEWQAFQLSVYGESDNDGRQHKLSATDAGNRLGLTAERVHAYKFRVLRQLRELMTATLKIRPSDNFSKLPRADHSLNRRLSWTPSPIGASRPQLLHALS